MRITEKLDREIAGLITLRNERTFLFLPTMSGATTTNCETEHGYAKQDCSSCNSTQRKFQESAITAKKFPGSVKIFTFFNSNLPIIIEHYNKP